MALATDMPDEVQENFKKLLGVMAALPARIATQKATYKDMRRLAHCMKLSVDFNKNSGTNTKEFLVQCNMSLDTAIANIDYDVGIGLNGADPSQWMTKTSRGVANDIIVISSMAHVELDQNEYIEVFARGSNAGADVVTILHGQLSARNISFKALP